MDKLNQEKQRLETLLAEPDIYESAQKQQLKELLQQQADVSRTLDETEEQWMQLSEELEEAQV